MKISLLVPTRGRPMNMHRVWTSALSTANNKEDLEIIFYIDDDDSESIEKFDSMKNNQVKAVFGNRICLSQCWNKALEASSGDILWHGGDDNIFRTKGWDDIVRNEFNKYEDKMVFVFGRDGINDGCLGTHGFLHRNWVDVAGYFCPPYFVSDYNDTWFNDVFNDVGRRIFNDNFYIEHCHWLNHKATIDKTHAERLERHKKEDVDNLYLNLRHKRDEDILKIKNFIAAKSKEK